MLGICASGTVAPQRRRHESRVAWCVSIVCVVTLSLSFFTLAVAFITLTVLHPATAEVALDEETMWYYLRDRDPNRDGPLSGNPVSVHLIPVCALAPTIPRTLVPDAGWNSSSWRERE